MKKKPFSKRVFGIFFLTIIFLSCDARNNSITDKTVFEKNSGRHYEEHLRHHVHPKIGTIFSHVAHAAAHGLLDVDKAATKFTDETTKVLDTTTKIVDKVPGLSLAVNGCLEAVDMPPLNVIDKAVDSTDSSIHKINKVINKSQTAISNAQKVKNRYYHSSHTGNRNVYKEHAEHIHKANNLIHKAKGKKNALYNKKNYLQNKKEEYIKTQNIFNRYNKSLEQIKYSPKKNFHLSRVIFINQQYLDKLSSSIEEEKEPELILHLLQSFKESSLNTLDAYEKLYEYINMDRGKENEYNRLALYAYSLIHPQKKLNEISRREVEKGIMHNIDLIDEGMFEKYINKIRYNLSDIETNTNIQTLKKDLIDDIYELKFLHKNKINKFINDIKLNNFEDIQIYFANISNRFPHFEHVIKNIKYSISEIIKLCEHERSISEDMKSISSICHETQSFARKIMNIVNKYKSRYHPIIKDNTRKKTFRTSKIPYYKKKYFYDHMPAKRSYQISTSYCDKTKFKAKFNKLEENYNKYQDHDKYVFSMKKLLNDIIINYKINLINIKKINIEDRRVNMANKCLRDLKSLLNPIFENLNYNLTKLKSKAKSLYRDYKKEINSYEDIGFSRKRFRNVNYR